MKNTSKFPKILFLIYVIVFAIGSINPYARDVWFVENATVWIVLIPIIILYFKGIRFSNFSYLLMSIFIILHTIGGHYTFERVPFSFFDNLFNLKRDSFDRVAHFTVGFYAFPIAEYLMSRGLVAKKWIAIFFGLFAIMGVAALYEIFEWVYAILSDPAAGIAVLGSQGDIWDAQKDMLCDTLGAVVAVITFNFWGKK